MQRSKSFYSSVSRAALFAVLMGGAVVTGANAQDTAEDGQSEDDVIVVEGFRASERASVETKRDAKSVVEAVTAEDIGELPDRGIAETLELLPGVTGNQDRGRSNTLSVRGLGGEYTQVTINGREVVSSFGGRSVNLNLYPSEAVRAGLVYKTPLPEHIAGGVGGTIEMKTLRPLDLKDNVRALNVFGLYNPNAADVRGDNGVGENISGIITQKFNDQFAIALGAAYLNEPLMGDRINIGDINNNKNWLLDFDGDGDTDELSSGFVSLTPNYRDEERISYFGSAQWQPNDQATITFDALHSTFEFEQNMAVLNLGGLNGGGSGFNSSVVGTGTVDDRGYAVAATVNTNVGFGPNAAVNEDETSVFGLNGEYVAGDWTFEGDLSYSEGERLYGYMATNIVYPTAQRDRLTFDYRDDPDVSFVFEDDTDLMDYDRATNVAFVTDNRTVTTDELTALALSAARETEGFFTEWKFGGRYSTRNKTVVADNERYADSAVTSLTAEEVASEFPFSDPFPSFDSDLPMEWMYFKPQTILALSGHGDDRDGDQNNINSDLLAGSDITEDTIAAYAQAEFLTLAFGRPLSGVVGVRAFQTDVSSGGYIAPFTVTQNPNETFSVSVTGDPEAVTLENDYSEVLPSLNMTWEYSAEFLVRLAAGRSLIRPNFTELGSGTTISNGNFTPGQTQTIGSGGNPYLEPVRSDQVDVSFEWYPRRGEIFSVAAFYKELDGVYETAGEFVEIEGADTAIPISIPVKSEDGGSISGIELNMRKELDFLPGILGGLSLSGNYTTMNIDLQEDYNINRDDQPAPNETLYLPQGMIEETYSLTLAYDQGGPFTGRINYYGQGEVVSRDGGDLFLRRPYETLNGSLSYELADNMTLVFQAANLLDSVVEHGQISSSNIDQPYIDFPRRLESTGRRFRIGLRAKF